MDTEKEDLSACRLKDEQNEVWGYVPSGSLRAEPSLQIIAQRYLFYKPSPDQMIRAQLVDKVCRSD